MSARVRRLLVGVAGVLGAAVVAVAAIVLPRQPTYDHHYRADQAVLPEVTVQGHLATVRHVRDFRHFADGRQRPGW